MERVPKFASEVSLAIEPAKTAVRRTSWGETTESTVEWDVRLTKPGSPARTVAHLRPDARFLAKATRVKNSPVMLGMRKLADREGNVANLLNPLGPYDFDGDEQPDWLLGLVQEAGYDSVYTDYIVSLRGEDVVVYPPISAGVESDVKGAAVVETSSSGLRTTFYRVNGDTLCADAVVSSELDAALRSKVIGRLPQALPNCRDRSKSLRRSEVFDLGGGAAPEQVSAVCRFFEEGDPSIDLVLGECDSGEGKCAGQFPVSIAKSVEVLESRHGGYHDLLIRHDSQLIQWSCDASGSKCGYGAVRP